jgi:hypothetical protein
MRNWLYQAESDSPVLWSCLGCPSGGQFVNDRQGRADHRARFGHLPAPGRPLAPVMGQAR